MHVYIVRHTSVVLDGNETCYGDMDIDVRPTFEEEASVTRAALEGLSFDGVFSSPLQRPASSRTSVATTSLPLMTA